MRANLRARGISVHGVSRRSPAGENDGTIWHDGDLLEPGTAKAIVRDMRPTHLMHLAWVTAPGEHATALSNLDWASATIDLVRRAHDVGCKYVVCAGTAAEYDWKFADFSEDKTPLHPATIYGEAKNGVRKLLSAYSDRTDLKLGWGRVFYAYGPREHPNRLIPRAIRALSRRERFACSNLTFRRDLLYVTDMAAAFVALLDRQTVGAFNVASGTSIPLRSVLDLIGKLLSAPELLQYGALDEPVGEPAEIRADVSHLRAATGWAPHVSLEEGLKRTIEYQMSDLCATK